MTLKSSTNRACAACKYQRRKCTVNCDLAPYFPADQPKLFLNAHRLFGVSNILKILKEIDPRQHKVAMKSIIYQANARERYPVYGCVAEMRQLFLQIQLAEEELQAVHAQLVFYKQQQQQQEISITSTPNETAAELQSGMVPPSTALPLFQQDVAQHCNAVNALPIASHPSYSSSGDFTYSTSYMDPKENHVVNSLWTPVTPEPYTISNDNNQTVMQSHLIAFQALSIQEDGTQDYDEIHPFFDTIDGRQSYIDSKGPYESSSESSLKDTPQSVEHVAENELKSAAACFSLTSVNVDLNQRSLVLYEPQ